jgi:hypothetical protein
MRAACVNFFGGFECKCQLGFIGNGYECKKDRDFEKTILEPGGGQVDAQGFLYFAEYKDLKVGDAGVISSNHSQIDGRLPNQRTEWQFSLTRRFT